MQRYGMPEFQEPSEPSGGAAARADGDRPGSAKDEFLVALREFRADCGVRSLRALTRVSETLRALYPAPANPPCELHPLSLTAVSEILSGKRQGLPSFNWVASFVLSCQRYAVDDRPGRRDQGTTILPHWHAIYSAHAAGAHPADLEAAAASGYRLSPLQRDYLCGHGPHGEVLVSRAQHGHPHARYRVALLLATEESRIAEATGILIDTASTGHPLALDLLDVREVVPSGWPRSPGAQLSGPAVARQAYDLAAAAQARGSADEALVLFRAAARGGIPEAAVEVAQAMLAGIDPEVADWLSVLGTQSAAGRHRALRQRPHAQSDRPAGR
jgi:hypothetical protein